MHLSRTNKLAGAAVVGALVLGAGGAAAWADSSAGTTTPAATAATAPAATAPAATPPAAAKHPKARALLARVDHGVLEIKDAGGWVTVDFDRGKVTDVAADHITLARPDGQSVTLKLTPTTTYHGVTSETQIQTGKGAVVISNPDGTARQVAQAAKK